MSKVYFTIEISMPEVLKFYCKHTVFYKYMYQCFFTKMFYDYNPCSNPLFISYAYMNMQIVHEAKQFLLETLFLAYQTGKDKEIWSRDLEWINLSFPAKTITRTVFLRNMRKVLIFLSFIISGRQEKESYTCTGIWSGMSNPRDSMGSWYFTTVGTFYHDRQTLSYIRPGGSWHRCKECTIRSRITIPAVFINKKLKPKSIKTLLTLPLYHNFTL